MDSKLIWPIKRIHLALISTVMDLSESVDSEELRGLLEEARMHGGNFYRAIDNMELSAMDDSQRWIDGKLVDKSLVG